MSSIFFRRAYTTAIVHSSRAMHLSLRRHLCSKVAVFCSESAHNIEKWLNPSYFVGSSICGKRSLKFLHVENYRLLTTTRHRCWQCNGVVTERDLVCLSCGCVQEPKDHLNHFELFKETPHFDLDTRILTIKFRRLQNLLHPDKFATRPDMEQKYSLEQSSRVNRAYQILNNPLERGLYLLELNEKPLLENEITMSSDFLEEIMDTSENLLKSKTVESIVSIRHSNNARLEVLFAELSQAFKEKNIDRARGIVAKLKYYITIDTQVKKMEEEMGISRDD